MSSKESPTLKVGLKMWIKGPSAPRSLFGPGDIRLLQSLIKTNNLTKSAQELNYSYKYAWQKLKDLKEKTGIEVVTTHRGGYGGGGDMQITPWGKYLMEIYFEINTRLNQFEKEINHYLEENSYQPPQITKNKNDDI